MGTKNHLDYIDNVCSLRRSNIKDIGTIIGIRSCVYTRQSGNSNSSSNFLSLISLLPAQKALSLVGKNIKFIVSKVKIS